MANQTHKLFRFPVATKALKQSGGNPFDLTADKAALLLIAAQTGVGAVRKARFSGTLSPIDKTDWELNARLGATVVQPCVVTLKPVTTRIDVPVKRIFSNHISPPSDGSETEFDVDESIDALGDEIDLGQVLVESLVLEIPEYPKADGAELENARFSEPGITPMSDDDAKPFASLAEFRAKMKE